MIVVRQLLKLLTVLDQRELLVGAGPRESDGRAVLSALPLTVLTPCMIGRYGQAVRALDGGGGSRSADKLLVSRVRPRS